uniref:SH3b domain-containing protein n=1 Tax=uncultured bacterium contig00043 TaxID=1181530 RepID=A0A806KHY9_9BACT|nr:protein of unknown function DUF1058 [uncultured bacterium contig00043]
MKKIFILLAMGFAVIGFVSAQASKGGTMYVATKTLALKSSTGFFASTKGTLNYGDRVTVLQINGKYVEVRSASNSSLTGWVQTSNLSARQIASGNSSTASAREVALAGKGFNQEVENSYKSKGSLNYADVDFIEALSLNEADLKRFLEEGRLKMGE